MTARSLSGASNGPRLSPSCGSSRVSAAATKLILIMASQPSGAYCRDVPTRSLQFCDQLTDFVGDQAPLPSEKDLVGLFGVARDTTRRAIALLRDEGLVVTVPQRGTYVVDRLDRERNRLAYGRQRCIARLGLFSLSELVT